MANYGSLFSTGGGETSTYCMPHELALTDDGLSFFYGDGASNWEEGPTWDHSLHCIEEVEEDDEEEHVDESEPELEEPEEEAEAEEQQLGPIKSVYYASFAAGSRLKLNLNLVNEIAAIGCGTSACA